MKSILQYLKENLGEISARIIIDIIIFMVCLYEFSRPGPSITKFLNAVGNGSIKLYQIALIALPVIILIEMCFYLAIFAFKKKTK